MNVIQLTSDISVAPQITAEHMEALKEAGFQTIISNRPDGEGYGQPENSELAKATEAAGLTFHYVPIIPGRVGPADVQAMANAYNDAPKPALAFCKTGIRSAMIWAISQKDNLPAQDIIQAGEKLGMDFSHLVQ